MDLILATSAGVEECVLDYDFDFEVGEQNTFQIRLTYGTWDERIQIGKLVYIPETEYGGIIKKISSATNTEEITLEGYTWRGYLAHRIISPPSGSDYYIASGDLNNIISSVVSVPGFRVADFECGVSVSNYKFNRYIDVASGLETMCESVGFRLDIKYIQTASAGYVLVQAVPAGNYGGDIEYSQDSMIDFSSVDNQMAVNHLVCLGIGELKNRLVLHLYADANGNVSQTQTLNGINEIVDKFDNSGAETQTLIDTGTRRLKELQGGKSFTPSLKTVDFELFLGDIVSGKDYITGNSVTQPITDKIVRRDTGWVTYEYKISEPKNSEPSGTSGTGGKTIFDMVYPVGSIYMSVASTDPGVLFGGTWVQLKDCFLLAAGTTYTAGATGGEAAHTLIENEMPNHSHKASTNNMLYAFGGGSTTTGPASGSGYRTTLADIDTGSVGGGQAHNNMPPYLVVYVWKRTA